MAGKLTEGHRQALKTFRERHGETAESLKAYVADFRRERKQITEALRAGPATVPELAQRTGLAADRALWHVTAMRKYGLAREVGPEGDYVKYALVEQNGK